MGSDNNDYAPVGYYDDEDELLKHGGYAPAVPDVGFAPRPAEGTLPIAPLPVDRTGAGLGVRDNSDAALSSSPYPAPQPGSTADLEAHASHRISPYPAPAPEKGSTADLEALADAPRAMPVATPQPQRPQWKDYAPAEPHGWAKFGHFMAGLNPATNRFFNEMPEQRAEKKYQTAVSEYEAPQVEAAREAETDQKTATAEKDRADAFKATHPQPKEGLTPEETTIHDLMTGENGGPRVNPANGKPYSYLDAYTAVAQAKQDTKPDKPDPAVKDKEKDISDWLASHHLDDTPTNREAARQGIANRTKDFGAKNDARSDKSYQLQSGRLDKIRQPVDQLIQRLGRLNDTLAQNNPQADALIAPELMTVMAGGQGSGLRMTDTEIERIVGGRSAWENLKAKVQHWSTNPEEARSITPDQDKQIRALVSMVHSKLASKQQILDETEESLISSDDPKEHRRIVADARKKLDAIDGGGGVGGGDSQKFTDNGVTYNIPKGKVDDFKKAHPNAK